MLRNTVLAVTFLAAGCGVNTINVHTVNGAAYSNSCGMAVHPSPALLEATRLDEAEEFQLLAQTVGYWADYWEYVHSFREICASLRGVQVYFSDSTYLTREDGSIVRGLYLVDNRTILIATKQADDSPEIYRLMAEVYRHEVSHAIITAVSGYHPDRLNQEEMIETTIETAYPR